MNNTCGQLYIVATPIGNLGDMTFRAVETLAQVDMILCEDTRVTKKLLHHFDIATPYTTYHQHTSDAQTQRIIEQIRDGKTFACVTDAGTPGVSDPGNKLVSAAVAHAIDVMPIPGVSAVSTMISVAGVDMQTYTFMAYPPHKKGRQTFFRTVAARTMPVVYYDSVHRVLKNLTLLAELDPDARVIVGRELTKMHEQIVRGNITEVAGYFTQHPDTVRGEFVIIVDA